VVRRWPARPWALSNGSETLRTEKESSWVPDRQEIIWIDCNPQAGREMRDVHPFLVLSQRIFNEKTSLVIGLPMTTVEYNADNPFAMAVGRAKWRKAGHTRYVLCHQPKSFDWRLRGAKPHPLVTLSDALFVQVRERLNQIVGLA
jgi:mRNA interferase MazF